MSAHVPRGKHAYLPRRIRVSVAVALLSALDQTILQPTRGVVGLDDHDAVIDKNKRRLNLHLDRWQGKLPGWAEGCMRWLRKPSSRWLRIPIGVLLIVAGLLGVFLPVLGFWMVIPGLLLLAIDAPFLRGPIRVAIVRVGRVVHRLRQRWRKRRR